MNNTNNTIISVDRACGDLRRGLPIVISDGKNNIIALSPENLTNLRIISDHTNKTSSDEIRLVLSSLRIKALNNAYKDSGSKAINIANRDNNIIQNLCGSISSLSAKNDTVLNIEELQDIDDLEQNALKLVKIAELIPSVITLKTTKNLDNQDFNILTVTTEQITRYKDLVSYELHEQSRTPLRLKDAEDCKIIAYRPNVGGQEHFAIVIGKPSHIPLVRIHSSCYTGDLLASLSCDCRDQLHSAIHQMADHKDGGIILYMMQEGRGIGLINKLRAYNLKEQGMDTVDANQALGFDDDERVFGPAAEILKHLGVKKVRLLSNNPRKAKGLEELSIEVVECVPHITESNKHNEEYLKTKSNRLGHKMD